MKQAGHAMSSKGAAGSRRAVSARSTPAKQHHDDPLRRFTSTPYTAALPVMGRTVLLETNSSRILDHVAKLFAPYPGSTDGNPDFRWRIVVQSDVQMSPPWPKRSVFSAPGLRFAEFGQRNFLAVDTEARQAIAFISEGLASDTPGFTSPFLDTLFHMTASSLSLVSFSAACVALGTRGLLVMGSPDQGKTTASYLAAKSGLKFHADQGVFLEMQKGRLRAWGDFVPVAFRPQALQFLPELQTLTRLFSYCDFNFHYLDRHQLDSGQAKFVTPIGCIFLTRGSASVPRMVRLAGNELSGRLAENIAFKENDRFEGKRVTVFKALAQLPAYHLTFGKEPAIAVPFFRDLLMKHAVLETETRGED